MRLYGKKFLGKKVQRQISDKKETRDAIVWDILSAQKVARVRIQGSSTNIIAHYPTSWETAPSWLKPGNIVRINFVGGNRQRVEVIGTGKLRPTPVDGSASTPTNATPEDSVLTGCQVLPIPLNNRMAVMVKTGTYRVSGTTYTLDAVAMGEGDEMIMGDGCVMGETAAIVDIDSVAAGYYRIDYIVVGADGTVDYVKGTAATSDPVEPTLPADHVYLGKVFVYSGITAITANEINQSYAAPVISRLSTTYSDQSLAWAELTCTITVSVLDQYGNAYSGGDINISCKMMAGNGTIAGTSGSTTSLDDPVYSYDSGSGAVFTYTRNQLTTDRSPVFQIKTEETPYSLMDVANIYLYDASGDKM